VVASHVHRASLQCTHYEHRQDRRAAHFDSAHQVDFEYVVHFTRDSGWHSHEVSRRGLRQKGYPGEHGIITTWVGPLGKTTSSPQGPAGPRMLISPRSPPSATTISISPRTPEACASATWVTVASKCLCGRIGARKQQPQRPAQSECISHRLIALYDRKASSRGRNLPAIEQPSPSGRNLPDKSQTHVWDGRAKYSLY